jgi:[acyl-carrier-protein] S-malonyltransferase
MQTAVPVGEGAMAAIIGLDDDTITAICSDVTAPASVVEAVNFNAPGQVVIAGHTAAVARASEALKDAGAKRALPLPVSAPFHTSLMRPAGERLHEVLESLSLRAPCVPVVHNVHARTESDPKVIHRLLVDQVSSPVLWTACMQTMRDAGVEHIIECGPGKVLGGLMRRIDRDVTCQAIEEPDDLQAALAASAA